MKFIYHIRLVNKYNCKNIEVYMFSGTHVNRHKVSNNIIYLGQRVTSISRKFWHGKLNNLIRFVADTLWKRNFFEICGWLPPLAPPSVHPCVVPQWITTDLSFWSSYVKFILFCLYFFPWNCYVCKTPTRYIQYVRIFFSSFSLLLNLKFSFISLP